jgi:Protein of unknown function (DUF1579)
MLRNHSALLVGAAVLVFGVGGAAALSAGVSSAQPATKDKAQPAKPGDKPAAPAGQPDMAAMEVKPTEHHKQLDALLGTWEGTVKFWMAPGSEAMESTGTVKREWDMDGLFMVERVTGKSVGMPGEFKGMGIIGYNTTEKRYESTWIENMATHITFMTGKYDAAKKTLTFEGDAINPMTGKREKRRDVIDLSNPTKHTMAGYCAGPDGKEFKNFEGTFTKK